jgi:di/tricarboxylate transporter
MTWHQSLSVAILVGMMGLFVWGRLRFDIVAGLALLAAVIAGVVPAKDAFKGFSDDIVIIVGSALVVSAAVARSGVIERALRHASPYLQSLQMQVAALVVSVGLLSAFVKNIGALAMLMPIAFQLARKGNRSPSVFLMPMAFAALLGGIVTLVGTSPNVIVARVRGEITGTPFAMFDFAPVGLGIAIAGIAFLCVGYRLLPRDRRGAAGLDEALAIKTYVTEARIGPKSRLVGGTLTDLKAIGGDAVAVTALVRGGKRMAPLLPDAKMRADDVLLIKGSPATLDRLVKDGGLVLDGRDRQPAGEDPSHAVTSAEAVIGPDSVLIGRSAGEIALNRHYQVNLLAVGRSGETIKERLRDVALKLGDIIVLQGRQPVLPSRMTELGLLPLAERTITLGTDQRGWIAMAVLAATILVLALGLVPVALAFFAAAVLLVLFGAIPAREAYEAVEWPILVMLAALIPVSDALTTTGTTEVMATWLSHLGASLPGWGSVALILVAAMAVTPFLNNAATVLVMAPIGAGFAANLGYKPDAFLMAVAIGAACDFLTPIGHQCNTLVMAPGGYKFTDYPRLGAPLSLLVILLGVPLILLVWPLK